MDFLDPKKRRAHNRRLMLGYLLVAIALAISSLILVLVASGYGINRKTGDITQNAMVFVGAHPESATVYINGENKGSTDSRYLLEEGKYSFELKRDGYRTWQRDLVLDGSSVERLVYPFLFPNTLVSKDAQVTTSTYDVASESPDRHWIVMHDRSAGRSFTVADTSKKETPLISIELPVSVFADHPNLTFEAVEWSTDNRHLLLKAIYDGGSEYVMFDRQAPASSINISQVFAHSYTQVALRDKRADQLYVYDTAGGVLQTADIATKQTQVVEARVLAFWPYANDTMLYVKDDAPAPGRVSVEIEKGGNTYMLRTLPVSDRYLLNIASFSGHDYVLAGSSSESRAYLYRDPIDLLKKNPPQPPAVLALLKVDKPAEFATFSGNARFVAVQGGNSFAVYDLEMNRQYRYDVGFDLPAGRKATWMDGHRMSAVADDKLRVFDFDGTNTQSLLAADKVFPAFFDRDYEALYTVSPSLSQPGKPALVRTELLVKK